MSDKDFEWVKSEFAAKGYKFDTPQSCEKEIDEQVHAAAANLKNKFQSKEITAEEAIAAIPPATILGTNKAMNSKNCSVSSL